MKKIIPLLLLILSFAACKEQIAVKVYDGDSQKAILDNMLTRRAIRKYTEQQVSQAQIDTIMKYSIYAPSAWNKQPYEIRVVQNKQWLDELNKRYKDAQKTPNSNPEYSIFHNSPTLIVIAKDLNNDYSSLDCGIVLQNILLSAHGIGLATCPLVLPVPTLNDPDNRDLLNALNISQDYEAAACISLGYAAESPQPRPRSSDRVKIIE